MVLADGTRYAPLAAGERRMLSNNSRMVAGTAQATVAGQRVLEGGGYARVRDPAANLRATGRAYDGSTPLILDFEHEGLTRESHERLAALVRLAKADAPFRAVGVYGYPQIPYRKANAVATAEMASEGKLLAERNLSADWGRAALPKAIESLEAARTPATAEAPLVAVADFAAPSLYIPDGYGGSAEGVYRASRLLLRDAKRWGKPVIAFISPNYSGRSDKPALPPAERTAVLRACWDEGAVPLVYFSDTENNGRPLPQVLEGARAMAAEWEAMQASGPSTAPAGEPAQP